MKHSKIITLILLTVLSISSCRENVNKPKKDKKKVFIRTSPSASFHEIKDEEYNGGRARTHLVPVYFKTSTGVYKSSGFHAPSLPHNSNFGRSNSVKNSVHSGAIRGGFGSHSNSIS